MITAQKPWELHEFLNADTFINHMLTLGTPQEVSVIGNFKNSGRGSLRDIELPWHRDGDYSQNLPNYKGRPSIVGFYCIKPGPTITGIKHGEDGDPMYVVLKKGQALIFDNNLCWHNRNAVVNDRLLIRFWIK